MDGLLSTFPHLSNASGDQAVQTVKVNQTNPSTVSGLTKEQLQANRELTLNKERSLLQRVPLCSDSSVIVKHLSDLNPIRLSQLVTEQPYNTAVMDSVHCLLQGILFTGPSGDQVLGPQVNGELSSDERLNAGNPITDLDRLRHWLRNLHQIGAESAFGIVMKADLGHDQDQTKGDPQSSDLIETARNFFVIKAPKDQQVNEDLTHELFVGLFGTNTMRALVPNFAYVFGGFSCLPPIVSTKDKSVMTWCTSDGNIHYVVYENINPGLSMYDFSKSCSVENFLQQYLQILFAIRLAQIQIDFTHYDLHGNNVLVKQLGTTVSIPYQTERGLEYLTSNGIATIIDYGRSHFVYQGNHYGVYDALQWFVYPRRSHPLHDAYKLLLTCLHVMVYYRNPAVTQLQKIVTFFSDEPLELIIQQESSSSFSLPYTPEFSGKNLDLLIEFIRAEFDCGFITSGAVSEVFACGESCLDREAVLTEIGLFNGGLPKDLFDFVDLYYLLPGTVKKDGQSSYGEFASDYAAITRPTISSKRFKLLTLFGESYETIRDQELIQFYGAANFLAENIAKLNPQTLLNLDANEVFTEVMLEDYQDYVQSILPIYDLVVQFDLRGRVITSAARLYNDRVVLKTVEVWRTALVTYFNAFNVLLANLVKDGMYLEGLIAEQWKKRVIFVDDTGRKQNMSSWRFRLSVNPKLEWYDDTAMLLQDFAKVLA